MPPTDENVRVPVVVLNVFQLACPAAIFGAVALGLPAVEIDLFGLVKESLFTAYIGGQRVLYATITCTVLGLLQTFVIGDPARGTPRHKFGIALAALALVSGLVTAHGAYRVGFEPFGNLQPRALIAAYIGLFGGLGFSAFAYVRLARFLERRPAAPAPPSATPG